MFFSKSLHPCALDESCFSIRRVNHTQIVKSVCAQQARILSLLRCLPDDNGRMIINGGLLTETEEIGKSTITLARHKKWTFCTRWPKILH